MVFPVPVRYRRHDRPLTPREIADNPVGGLDEVVREQVRARVCLWRKHVAQVALAGVPLSDPVAGRGACPPRRGNRLWQHPRDQDGVVFKPDQRGGRVPLPRFG